jgi:hypothetical protein
MVVAAASVVAFGVLGLALVTGHLRKPPTGGDNLVTAEAAGPVQGTTVNKPAAALTETVKHN